MELGAFLPIAAGRGAVVGEEEEGGWGELSKAGAERGKGVAEG